MFALVVVSSASAGRLRATATTGAPASANARAIPRPRPRLAPTTTVVLPDKSLIIVPFFACPWFPRSLPREVGGAAFRTRHWLGGGTIPPDTSLLFGAVFGDSAPISFGERAGE